MNRILSILLLIALCAASLTAQSRKKTKPAPGFAARAQVASVQTMPQLWDSIAPAADSIGIAGYEKTLKATRESMLVINRSSQPFEAIKLEIAYLDMAGNMLHKATHMVDVSVPPGETRMVNVPTFDRQGLFYYHLSPVPTRAVRATPFEVKVSVKNIYFRKNSDSQ